MNRPVALAQYLIPCSLLASLVLGCGLVPPADEDCEHERQSVDAGDAYQGIKSSSLAVRLEGTWTGSIVYTQDLPKSEVIVTLSVLDVGMEVYICGSVKTFDLPVRLHVETVDGNLSLTFEGTIQCDQNGQVIDDALALSFPASVLAGAPILPQVWRATASGTVDFGLAFTPASSQPLYDVDAGRPGLGFATGSIRWISGSNQVTLATLQF